MKITIERDWWRTGGYGPYQTGTGPTQLEDEDGYKCCLGFVCSQACPHLPIYGFEGPEELQEVVPSLSQTERGARVPTGLTNAAIRINDDPETTREEKEVALLKLFADSPYELEFV